MTTIVSQDDFIPKNFYKNHGDKIGGKFFAPFIGTIYYMDDPYRGRSKRLYVIPLKHLNVGKYYTYTDRLTSDTFIKITNINKDQITGFIAPKGGSINDGIKRGLSVTISYSDYFFSYLD